MVAKVSLIGDIVDPCQKRLAQPLDLVKELEDFSFDVSFNQDSGDSFPSRSQLSCDQDVRKLDTLQFRNFQRCNLQNEIELCPYINKDPMVY